MSPFYAQIIQDFSFKFLFYQVVLFMRYFFEVIYPLPFSKDGPFVNGI